jgi:hypothetical protein
VCFGGFIWCLRLDSSLVNWKIVKGTCSGLLQFYWSSKLFLKSYEYFASSFTLLMSYRQNVSNISHQWWTFQKQSKYYTKPLEPDEMEEILMDKESDVELEEQNKLIQPHTQYYSSSSGD